MQYLVVALILIHPCVKVNLYAKGDINSPHK